MPRLARLYVRHCLIGFALSASFVLLLLWFDVARIWTMASHDGAGILAIAMLWIFNGIVFAGVQFAIAVQRVGRQDTPPSGGRRVPLSVSGALLPVRAEAPRRR